MQRFESCRPSRPAGANAYGIGADQRGRTADSQSLSNSVEIDTRASLVSIDEVGVATVTGPVPRRVAHSHGRGYPRLRGIKCFTV